MVLVKWLDLMRGSQRHSRDSWKTTLGSQVAYLENWHSDSLKRFTLRVRKRRRMKLLKVKVMMMIR
jgi:hypothetical protein